MKNIFLFSFFLALLGCSKNDFPTDVPIAMIGRDNQMSLKITPDGLNRIVEKLLNDDTQVLSTELKYSQEADVWYLESRAIKGPRKQLIGMVLARNSTGGIYPPTTATCTHRCDVREPCSGCTMVIHTECKSLSCNCNSGGGGCNTEIE
jgi:hypothetical protein